MTLAIEVGSVSAVCVKGTWYTVVDGSFDLDEYEFMHHGESIVEGAEVDGLPATGFVFRSEEEGVVVGPLTSIDALRIEGWIDGQKRAGEPEGLGGL